VAAAAVVLFQLLPEAWGELRLRGLIAFLAAVAVPAILDLGARRVFGQRGHGLAFEIGYLGLLIHSAGDGLGLWVFVQPEQRDLGVIAALVGHIVPLTAGVVLHVAGTRGPRPAALRALGLALATAMGVLSGELIPEDLARAFEPWISAVVAGLLVHVVAHDRRHPH
jgi:hypothetical protein